MLSADSESRNGQWTTADAGGLGSLPGQTVELVRTKESAVRNVPVIDCCGVGAVVPGRQLQHHKAGVLVYPQCVGSVGCWTLIVRTLGYW